MNGGTTVAAAGTGASIAFPLFLVFLVLKVAGIVSWGWLIVFSPLLISFGLSIVITLVVLLFIAGVAVATKR